MPNPQMTSAYPARDVLSIGPMSAPEMPVDPTETFPHRLAAIVRNVDAVVVRSPGVAIALAIVAGFVIGGGLSMRVGRLVFMSAARQGLRRLF